MNLPRILLINLFLIYSGICISYSQSENTSSTNNVSVGFRVTTSMDMFLGIRKSDYFNNRILRTPPSLGPEVSVNLDLGINEKATLTVGFSYFNIPLYSKFYINGGLSYAPDDILKHTYYSLELLVISLPISYQHSIKISESHHINLELGAGICYNFNNLFIYKRNESLDGYPDYFSMYINGNDKLKWFPSGFIKAAYRYKLFNSNFLDFGLRYNFSGAVLGNGAYKFNGFEGDNFFNGNLKIPINYFALDVTYGLRYITRKK